MGCVLMRCFTDFCIMSLLLVVGDHGDDDENDALMMANGKFSLKKIGKGDCPSINQSHMQFLFVPLTLYLVDAAP